MINMGIRKKEEMKQDKIKDFIWDFSIEFLKKACQGENLLISPISVLAVLQMLYHGTAGTTRQQIESVLHTDMEELEKYLESVFGTDAIGTDEKTTIGFSNAVCVTRRDDISICESFKEKVLKSSYAEFFELPREEIKDTLNAWSEKKTNGMIPEIIESVSDRSILHVLNALSFEAEWHDKFDLSKTKKGLFVNEKGIEEEVDFMVHDDEYFLSDRGYDGTIHATGFVKPYMNKRYAFVALLPGEDITLQEYINTLEGERLDCNLRCYNGQKVVIRVPRLKIKCQTDMKEVINNLGITEVFSEYKADFSNLFVNKADTEDVLVNKFIQKTCLELEEAGTKAYASLFLTIEKSGVKEIISLNRPFLYAIYDRQKEIPLFLGAMTNMSDKKIELNHLKDEDYERYNASIQKSFERLKIFWESDDSDYTDRQGFLGEIWGGIWHCTIDDIVFRFRIHELDEATKTCKITIYTNDISHSNPVTIKGVIPFMESIYVETQWERMGFSWDDPRCGKCKLLLMCSQIKRITDDNLRKFISAMVDNHLDMITLYREN